MHTHTHTHTHIYNRKHCRESLWACMCACADAVSCCEYRIFQSIYLLMQLSDVINFACVSFVSAVLLSRAVSQWGVFTVWYLENGLWKRKHAETHRLRYHSGLPHIWPIISRKSSICVLSKQQASQVCIHTCTHIGTGNTHTHTHSYSLL